MTDPMPEGGRLRAPFCSHPQQTWDAVTMQSRCDECGALCRDRMSVYVPAPPVPCDSPREQS